MVDKIYDRTDTLKVLLRLLTGYREQGQQQGHNWETVTMVQTRGGAFLTAAKIVPKGEIPARFHG